MKKHLMALMVLCLFAGSGAKAQFSTNAGIGLATDYNVQQLMAQEGMKVSSVLPLYYSASLRYEARRFVYALETARFQSEYRAYNGTDAGGIAKSAFTGISAAYNFLTPTSSAKLRGGLGVGWLSYSQSYRTIEPLASIGFEASEMERTLARHDGGAIAITPRVELEVPLAGRLSAISNAQMLLPLWANASVSKERTTYNGTGGSETFGGSTSKAVADVRFSFSFGLSFKLGKQP